MIKFLTILFISLSLTSILFAASCPGGTCLSCHEEYGSILHSAMAEKTKEKTFTSKTTDMFDPDFSKKNCSSCHVSSCADCHSEKNGKITKPGTAECLKCHRDGFTGGDYVGMGIREDHERYRRGPEHMGENYMKMLPDVHYEGGMVCGDCHSMASLSGNGKTSGCLSCHDYNKDIIDHSIKGHDSVACISCHAAWAPMELGTFYIRTRESSAREYFDGIKELSGEYLKSSFMRVNERPPLAIDEKTGTYVPIRPMFIIFTTDIYKNLIVGIENNMISNRWQTFTPHTVRREVPLCAACHDNRRRFLLETEAERILLTDKDGLLFRSFYSSMGFSISGGRFVSEEDYARINKKDKFYIKKYFEKLEQVKKLIN